jgi:tRNA threonylcarbamoyladenosine biosynthesis protein TsaE
MSIATHHLPEFPPETDPSRSKSVDDNPFFQYPIDCYQPFCNYLNEKRFAVLICWKSTSPEATREIGFKIGSSLKENAIISLEGGLGAGKTTLVKGLAAALGIHEEITSPSFTIMVHYQGTLPLVHIDLYRLNGIEELEELGLREIFDNRGISVIEWGERALSLYPAPGYGRNTLIRVIIEIGENSSRLIEVEGLDI